MVFTLSRQLSRGQLADRTAKYDDLTAEARRVSMTTSAAHQRVTFGRVSSTHSHQGYSKGSEENFDTVSQSSSASTDVGDADSNLPEQVRVQTCGGTFKQEHFRPKSAPFRPAMRRSQSVIGFSEPYAHRSVYDLAYQGKERLANQRYRFVKQSGACGETSSHESAARLESVRTNTAKRPKSCINSTSLSNCASQPQLHLDVMLPVPGKVRGPTGRAKSAIGPRTKIPTRSYREKYRRLAANRRERESTARRLFKPRTSLRAKPRGRAWGLLTGPVDKTDEAAPKESHNEEDASLKQNRTSRGDGDSADCASESSSESSDDETESPKDIPSDQDSHQVDKPDSLQVPKVSVPDATQSGGRETKAKGRVSKVSTPRTNAGARQACILRTKLTKLTKKSNILHVAGRLVRKARWLREQDERMAKSSEPVIHYFSHNPPSSHAQKPCWMPDYEVSAAECRAALQAKPNRTHHDLGTIYGWLLSHLSKDCWMYRVFQSFGYELCAKTRHVKKHASAEVICAGQSATHVYIVLTGSVSVWKFKSVMSAAATRSGYGEPVAQDLIAGEVFALNALLEASGVSGSHDVSVLANVDSELIVLHRDFFRTIMKAKYDEEIVRVSGALADYQFFKDLGPRKHAGEPARTAVRASESPRKPTESRSRSSMSRQEATNPSRNESAPEDDCEERQSVVETVEQSFYKRGSVAVRAGTPFTHLYFAVSGHCEVVQRESMDSHDFLMAEANEKFGDEASPWKFATVAILGRGALLTVPVPINPALLQEADKSHAQPTKHSGSKGQQQRPHTAHASLSLSKLGARSDRVPLGAYGNAGHQEARNAAHAKLLGTRPPVYSHTVRCVSDCVLLKCPLAEVEERLCAQSLWMLKSLGRSILESWNQRVGMLRSKTFRSREELIAPSEREYALHPMTQRRAEENKARVMRELFQVVKFGQGAPQESKSLPMRPKSALQHGSRTMRTETPADVQRRPSSAMSSGAQSSANTAKAAAAHHHGVERFRGVLFKSKSNPTLRASRKPRPHTANGSIPLRTCVASLERSHSQPNFYTGGPMSTYTMPTPAELAFNNTLASVPHATSLENPQLSRDLELVRGGASSRAPVLRAQPRQFLWEKECLKDSLPLDVSFALRSSKSDKGFSFSFPRSNLGMKADLFPLRQPKPSPSPKQGLTSSASTGRLPSLRHVKSAYRKSQQSATTPSRKSRKPPPSHTQTRIATPTLNSLTSPKFPRTRPLTSSMSVRSLGTGQNVYQQSAHTATGARTCGGAASAAKRVSSLHARTFKSSRAASIGVWRDIDDSRSEAAHGEVSDADSRRFSSNHFPRRKSLSRHASRRPQSLVSEAQSHARGTHAEGSNGFRLLTEEINSVRSQKLARRASANGASVSAHVEEDRHWAHSEPFRRQSLRCSQKFRANSSTPAFSKRGP